MRGGRVLSWSLSVVAVAVIAAVVPMQPMGVGAQQAVTERISGADRFATAALVAERVGGGRLDGLTDLLIVSGDSGIDAAVATGLAGYLDTCPRPDGEACRRTAILLTARDAVPTPTAEAIAASGVPAARITLLGGVSAVSEAVRDEVARTAGWGGAGDNPVTRIAGATRYDTATAVVDHVVALSAAADGVPLGASYRTVLIATGEQVADALAAGALASRGGHLLLLAPRSPDALPAGLIASIERLGASCAVVVGGPAALSVELETQLGIVFGRPGAGSCTVRRLAGADRHATAAAVAQYAVDEHGRSVEVLLVNPAAPSGSVTAATLARTGAALLFTVAGDLPDATATWLARQYSISRLIVFGGVAEVSESVAERAAGATRVALPPPPAPTASTTPTSSSSTTTTTAPPVITSRALRAGGVNSDTGSSIATFADGSAIVTGYFSDTIAFPGAATGSSLTSAGADDVFVAKVAADGTWAWATSAGNSGPERSFDITALADGSAIATGYFYGTLTFPGAVTGSVLTASGQSDVFVAKIAPDGTWLWASSAGGAGDDAGRGIAALADGSLIVTGDFYGATVEFPGAATGSSLTNVGLSNVFVAKVAADGTWVWATSAGGSNYDYPAAVATSPDGGAVLTGEFYGPTMAFPGAVTGSSLTNAQSGKSDAFVAKVSAGGSWEWATNVGDTANEGGSDVAVTSDGSAVVAGYFASDTLAFPGAVTGSSLTNARSGRTDMFVARVSAGGSWEWALAGGGNNFDYANAVSAFADGSVAIAGGFGTAISFPGAATGSALTSLGGDDLFVARVAPDGTWAWAVSAGAGGYDDAYGVATNADGTAMVVGVFERSMTIDGTVLTSAGSYDVLVARVAADGRFG